MGSTHGGSLYRATETAKMITDCGCIPKVQFLNTPALLSNNIALKFKDITALKSQFDNLICSTWTKAGIRMLFLYDIDIKLAASSDRSTLTEFLWENDYQKPVYISLKSCEPQYYPNGINLYCIAQYPVDFVVSFEGLFPKYDGFSDHTRGFTQTIQAVKAGAKYIEKHVMLDDSIKCADSMFAINPTELKKLVKGVEKCE